MCKNFDCLSLENIHSPLEYRAIHDEECPSDTTFVNATNREGKRNNSLTNDKQTDLFIPIDSEWMCCYGSGIHTIETEDMQWHLG